MLLSAMEDILKQSSLNQNGKAITYLEGGQGKDVLFLGGGGTDTYYYQSFLEKLAQNHHVVAINYPGFAGSTKIKEPYSEKYLSEMLFDFIAKLGLNKIILIGHSMGGGIALNYAVKYPEQIQEIILYSPLVEPQGHVTLSIAFKILRNYTSHWLKNPKVYNPPHKLLIKNTLRIRQMRKHIRYAQNFEALDWSKIKVPVKAILGKKDVVLNPKRQEVKLKEIPDIKIEILDQGHDAILLNKAQFHKD